MSSAGNLSIPAGTGVWVVKTVPARLASIGLGERQAVAGHELADPLQARGSRRGPRWSGISAAAPGELREPVPRRCPSRISWRRRCSVPPP